MGILSTNYAKKLLSIRKMEGLTQMRFSALTGISLSMIRNYETGQKPARAEVMEKVLKTEMFKKYTMWLLHDEEISMNDQVTTTVRQSEADILKVDKATKDIFIEIPSLQSSLHSIMNNISKLNNDELTELSTVISRRGALFLLDLLDPENQVLLNLRERKNGRPCV
ncbi:hypothetical protein CBG25_19110 [Arsenophonus sp. ENCA]|uniref:helix-turn-helix domain-containing protein n=1 Tax=Arsenophonus sp. ENCA TaxID=1987579 RepID=UPI000BD041D5|nr:helix-turn-helix transcriptional regulator [Arsenophonus sp. ENCA]PAV01028.1 hypothetical protein CBG25_19110 [Arsenophonus sp. ENCA]